MIEAYEGLREQLLDSRFRPDEARSLETMFDTWLQALYSIHNSMTHEGRSTDSDSHYDEPETPGFATE
jgi:hypothetical protein